MSNQVGVEMVACLRWSRRGWVTAAAAVLALASCGSDNDPATGDGGAQPLPTAPEDPVPPSGEGSTGTAGESTSTTVDELEAAEEALDAELRAADDRYWETTDALFEAPNPADPRLAEVATGPALTVVRDSLGSRQVEGVTEAYGPLDAREVLSVEWEGRGDPDVDTGSVTEAIVESCVVTDVEVYDAAGAVIRDSVTTSRVEQTLVQESGAWKVSESEFFDTEEGVQPCAAV